MSDTIARLEEARDRIGEFYIDTAFGFGPHADKVLGILDALIAEERKCSESPNSSILRELCEALGWQGGTIHQVVAEVKRLIEKARG